VLRTAGPSFPGAAESPRMRVRPASVDYRRSAAHEVPFHKRLPHPCAIDSGHSWPLTLLEKKARPRAELSFAPIESVP